MIKFNASIPKKKILRTYLDVVNGILKLTERERDILTILFELDLYWKSEKPKNIISMDSRRYVMQNTFINKNNLSKYISKFKDKGILKKIEEKKWVIDPNIRPSTLITNGNVEIKFNLKEDE